MNIVEIIKSQITLEQILAENGITSKRGRCPCPLHNGKNPTSFRVKNGNFSCFSCQAKGDVITLTQLLYNLDFKQALEYLTKKAGIKVGPEDISQNSVAKKSFTLTQLPVSYFEKRLWDAKADAVRFLQDIFSARLKRLNRDVNLCKISLCDFYTRYAETEEILAGVDELGMWLNYQRKKNEANEVMAYAR